MRTHLCLILFCTTIYQLSLSCLCGLQNFFSRVLISSRTAQVEEETLISLVKKNNSQDLQAKLQAGTFHINATDPQGKTALLEAVKHKYTDVVACLLDHGADPNQEDAEGNYPLHAAIKGEDQRTIMLLILNKKTDLRRSQMDGHTPLSIAAKKGNLYIVEQLLLKGIKPDQGILQIALFQRKTQLALLLLKHGATTERNIIEEIVHHYLPDNEYPQPNDHFLQLLKELTKKNGLPELSVQKKIKIQNKIGGSSLGLGQAFWEKLERIATNQHKEAIDFKS